MLVGDAARWIKKQPLNEKTSEVLHSTEHPKYVARTEPLTTLLGLKRKTRPDEQPGWTRGGETSGRCAADGACGSYNLCGVRT